MKQLCNKMTGGMISMKINQQLLKLNKKIGLSLLAASFVIGSSSGVLAAPISICVQNQQVNLGSNIPYISNTNQTMIPIRAVGNVLGLNTDWQNGIVILSGKNVKTNQMTYAKANVTNKTLVVNGKTMTNAVQLKNGTTYIVLRALSEAFGYNVGWNSGKISISCPQTAAPSKNNTASQNNKTSNSSNTTTNSNTNTQKPAQSGTTANQTTPTQSVSNSITAYENEVLNLVNIERQKAGLSALKMDEALRSVAKKKSEDMRINKYFSHTSPTYGSPFDMMKKFGINYTMAGENIAMGQRTPQEVVTAWMNSSGHRANILKAEYTHIGVGYDANGNYWTQMFIRK